MTLKRRLTTLSEDNSRRKKTMKNPFHVLLAVSLYAVCGQAGPPPVQSPFTGHYLGSVYVSQTGSVTTPETDVGTIDVEVFANGSFSGASTVLSVAGQVSAQGEMTFNPNSAGFTTGTISNNTLAAQADQPNGNVTVRWRLAATKGGVSSNLRITQQPASAHTTSGQSVALSVGYEGSASNFQWYQGNSGDTSRPLNVPNSHIFNSPVLTQSTSYWVRISDGVVTLDSQTAVITVTPIDGRTAPEITRQPQNATFATGQTASLTVQAQGITLSYQWYLGITGDTSRPIAQATAANYLTPPLEATVNQYWVRVTSGNKSIDSDTAVIQVVRATPLNAKWEVVGKTRFFFVPPSINEAGQVTYPLLGTGLVLGIPGASVQRNLQTFITSVGQSFGLDTSPVVTGDDSKVGLALENALIADFPGNTSIIAQNGGPAPGLASGITLEFPAVNPPFAMNPSGIFVLASGLRGPGITSGNAANDQAIFRGPPEDFKAIVRAGDAAPDLPAGYLFGGKLDEPFAVAISRDGTTVFRGRAIESRSRQFAQGLWLHSPAQGLKLAVKAIQQGPLKGDTAPGTGGAVFRELLSAPVVNDDGTIAFVASTFNFTGLLSGIGIWAGPSNDLQPVFIGGAPVPGMAGYQFDQPLLDPTLKLGKGRFICFRATILGPNVTAANNIGVFAGTSLTDLRLVARTGTRPPGAPESIQFADIQGNSLVVFGDNRLAFTAVLSGTELGANNNGIWATDALGDLQLLALSGDLVPTSDGNIQLGGGIFLQHGSGSDGRPTGGNRNGQITFLDGSIDAHAFRVTLEETATLQFHRAPNALAFTWPTGFSLQTSRTLSPQSWTDEPGESPKTVSTTQSQLFFRLIKR